MSRFVRGVFLWLSIGAALMAQPATPLRFANVFGDGIVLQQGKPLRLWGWAAPAAAVAVSIADGAATIGGEATADAEGLWVVTFAPLTASFTAKVITARAGDETVTLRDVLVGEVWLTSGQSNMRWGVNADTEWSMERECADFPAIRYASINEWQPQPLVDVAHRLRWRSLTRDNDELGGVSAVSYWFAVRLHRYLKVPVGILCNAVGGTLAEAWTSRSTLESLPELRAFLSDFDSRLQGWPEERARRIAEHGAKAAQAKAENREPPRPPDLSEPQGDRNQPSGCYNAAIAPLGRLVLRGALFLQGENNSIGRWNSYAVCFPAMIADWRRAFADAGLPFGIISLQAFGPHGLELEPEAVDAPPGLFWYAAIRDVHLRTFRTTPNTGLIAAHDLGDTADIHPALKRGVGERAARWALAKVYDRPVLHTGPIYREMNVAGDKIELLFDLDPACAKVATRKDDEVIWWLDYPISRAGQDYRDFVIAGADRCFHPAKVRRSRKPACLEVWSEAVPQPVAVRYAWSGYPAGNAVGHDLLPVPPFRTDDWPLAADTPFEPPARKTWAEEMQALRLRAARASDARKLGEARALIGRVAREAGKQLSVEERAAMDKEIADATTALERLERVLQAARR